jgi:hypothetical protein
MDKPTKCSGCAKLMTPIVDRAYIANINGIMIYSCKKCHNLLHKFMTSVNKECAYCNKPAHQISTMEFPFLKQTVYKAVCNDECNEKMVEQDYPGPLRDIKCVCGKFLNANSVFVKKYGYCSSCVPQ